MRVYVGTYAKYNSGSLDGEWIDITDFPDKEEFLHFCAEIHSDEDEPEFMFQDWESDLNDFPKGVISESYISEHLWELYELNEHEQQIIIAFANAYCCTLEYAITNAMDNYFGEFDSDEELGRYYINEGMAGENIPDFLLSYIDYKSYGRDIAMDMVSFDGHYFAY